MKDSLVRMLLWPFDDASINKALSNQNRELLKPIGQEAKSVDCVEPRILRQMNKTMEYPDSAQQSETAMYLVRK